MKVPPNPAAEAVEFEDWIAEDNPVRAVDAFLEALDLGDLGLTARSPRSLFVHVLSRKSTACFMQRHDGSN
jgi:hypothetical protein